MVQKSNFHQILSPFLEAQGTQNDARSSKMTSKKIVETKHEKLVDETLNNRVLKSSWGGLPLYRGEPLQEIKSLTAAVAS